MDKRLIILWILSLMVLGCNDPSPTPIVVTLTTNDGTESNTESIPTATPVSNDTELVIESTCEPLDIANLITDYDTLDSYESTITLLTERADFSSKGEWLFKANHLTNQESVTYTMSLSGVPSLYIGFIFDDTNTYERMDLFSEWQPAQQGLFSIAERGIYKNVPLPKAMFLNLSGGNCLTSGVEKQGYLTSHYQYSMPDMEAWSAQNQVQLSDEMITNAETLDLWVTEFAGQPLLVEAKMTFTNLAGHKLTFTQMVNKLNEPITIEVPSNQNETANTTSTDCPPYEMGMTAIIGMSFNSVQVNTTLSKEINGRFSPQTRITQQNDLVKNRERIISISTIDDLVDYREAIVVADEVAYVRNTMTDNWSAIDIENADSYLSMGSGFDMPQEFLANASAECISTEVDENGNIISHYRFDTSQIRPEEQTSWTILSGAELHTIELSVITIDGISLPLASTVPFTSSQGDSFILQKRVDFSDDLLEIPIPTILTDLNAFPYMDDAFELPNTEWQTISYMTQYSQEEVMQFYETYFFNNGWSSSDEITRETAGVTITGYEFSRFGQVVFVGVGAGEGNQIVTIKQIQAGENG